MLIRRIVVFSRLVVAPVASFKVSKNLSTFAADSWFCRSRLVSSAYWEILICLVLFGIWIPVTGLLILTFEVVTSPCMTYKGRESEPLKPLERVTWGERKPLFIIMEVLFLYSVPIKLTNIWDISNFSIVLKRKVLSVLSKAFCWTICNKWKLFFSLVYFMGSLTKKRLLNIVLFGIEQFVS